MAHDKRYLNLFGRMVPRIPDWMWLDRPCLARVGEQVTMERDLYPNYSRYFMGCESLPGKKGMTGVVTEIYDMETYYNSRVIPMKIRTIIDGVNITIHTTDNCLTGWKPFIAKYGRECNKRIKDFFKRGYTIDDIQKKP